MTGPRGGKTTVTAGGYRRVEVCLDEYALRALDSEVKRVRGQERSDAISRSEIVRRLVRRHITPEGEKR